MAGHAEIGTVGVFHSHIQAAPDDHATQYADQDHAQHGALRGIEEGVDESLFAFGLPVFVSHCSNPNWPFAAYGKRCDFESMEMARKVPLLSAAALALPISPNATPF
jgi:hypothetical protein